jgi:hypothetical protein
MRSANAVAIAGAAISAALFDALVEKNILTTSEALSILEAAQNKITPYLGAPLRTDDPVEAARIIGEMYGRLAKKSA